jgi:predicted nuclease of predicted toxin-antitoxin system
MRIKLDENLPLELIAQLGVLGHDVEHVHGENLSGRPDPDVWQAAQAEERLLITQDIAFGDARMFTPGQHAGFVLVRLKRPGRGALMRKVRNTFASEDVASWTGCFVVLSDSKVRVRRPS